MLCPCSTVGRGAFGTHTVRLTVSRRDQPADARFCESVESGHSAQGDAAAVAARLGITTPPLRMDSQAKYAVVARGEADIYLRLPTRADYREKIWDHAAGALIVTEAGGIVYRHQRPAARIPPRTGVDGQPRRDRLQRATTRAAHRGDPDSREFPGSDPGLVGMTRPSRPDSGRLTLRGGRVIGSRARSSCAASGSSTFRRSARWPCSSTG